MLARGICTNGAGEGHCIQALVRTSERAEAANTVGADRTMAQQSESKCAPTEASLSLISALLRTRIAKEDGHTA
jgi:hypothetical protein